MYKNLIFIVALIFSSFFLYYFVTENFFLKEEENTGTKFVQIAYNRDIDSPSKVFFTSPNYQRITGERMENIFSRLSFQFLRMEKSRVLCFSHAQYDPFVLEEVCNYQGCSYQPSFRQTELSKEILNSPKAKFVVSDDFCAISYSERRDGKEYLVEHVDMQQFKKNIQKNKQDFLPSPFGAE